METENNNVAKEECPDCIANNLPCARHCGKCGRIINAWLQSGPYCIHKHAGYRSIGGHLYCPDCGKSLESEKETFIISRKSIPKKDWKISQKECSHPTSSKLFGGRFNRRCDICGEAFEENASEIEHLKRN